MSAIGEVRVSPVRGASAQRFRPRAGDLVEVRSREEILGTLDDAGKLEQLPFMPEMLAYCGRRFRVTAVAHKTCDPAHKTGGRRLDHAVHLEGLRCDGSAHGGCQASCLLVWKTAWLRRPESAAVPSPPASAMISDSQLRSRALTAASTPAQPIYSCQATCLFEATRLLHWWDLRQYVRDVTSRNVTPGHAARYLFLSWLRALTRMGIAYRLTQALYDSVHRLLTGRSAPRDGSGPISRGTATPVQPMGLRAGQWVKVRSFHDIRATLNRDSKNRGMWFDQEQIIFCERHFQVEQRVERIINEVTGEMMPMKTPCITLQGVQCPSMYSYHRLFCPRAITPYWREIWLEPAAAPDTTGQSGA